MSQNKIILILSGAAGVGKSTVLQALKGFSENKQLSMDENSHFVASPTRDFYRSKGVQNEASLKEMTAQQSSEFQLEYFDYSLQYWAQTIMTSESKIMVLDRCPVDVLAYTFIRSINTMDKALYERCMQKLFDFFKVMSYENDIFIAHLHWPVQWSTEDDFRSSDYAKDLLSAITIEYLHNEILKKEFPRVKYNLYKPKPNQTPTDRAQDIVLWK